MKVTLDLDERLLRAAKKLALDRGSTLTSILDETLRNLLTTGRTGPKRQNLKWPTVKGASKPRVDIGDREALLQQMARAPDGGAPESSPRSNTLSLLLRDRRR